VRAQDLTGEARRLFEEWRGLGYTEYQALDRVRRSGLVREPELYETLRGVFGLSQEAAVVGALGRHPEPTDDHDQLARSFRETWGLSEAAADAAARGRDGGSRSAASGVSVAELAGLRPDPANTRPVVAAIEELTTELRGRGFSEGRPGMKRRSR